MRACCHKPRRRRKRCLSCIQGHNSSRQSLPRCERVHMALIVCSTGVHTGPLICTA